MSIGIDFGYSHVKIIEIEQNDNGIVIKKIGSKSILEDLNNFNPENIDKANWVAAIQELCQELNINPNKTKKVTSGLSGKQVSIKQITTLEMESQELITSLEFEAKKHIPLDGTEPIIDYHILGQNKEEIDKNDILLVATTKNYVSKHDEILKNSGFKGGIFDSGAISIMNAFLNSNNISSEGVDVLINIGNQNTTLMCWGENHRFFSRELDIAGYHFTKSTMEKNNVDFNEADSIKISKGVDAVKSDNSSQTEVDDPLAIKVEEQTIYSSLIEELRKTLRYYMKSSNQAYFNRFFMTGGSANLIGLKELIENELNVEIEIFDPVSNIDYNGNIDNPCQYTTALGLAIRGLYK